MPTPRPRAPIALGAALFALAATGVSAAGRHPAPSAPPVVEPHHDLYDGQPPPPAATPDPPGFRITVPLCRRAEQMNDPLAKTPECAQLIDAAKSQAEACKQAFETGDDKAVLSEGCRQAAGFR